MPAIVDSALEALLRTSGAVRARIRFLESAGLPARDAQPRTLAAPGHGDDAVTPTLEVPLANGADVVGQLALWYPDDADVTDRIGGAALSSLSSQIACAVKLAGAVGDLNRRKVEGHAFYDILLRASNQEPTLPVLDAVVQHAAALLGADAALVAVSPETSKSIRHELGPEAPTRRPDGATVVAFGLPTPAPQVEGEPAAPVDPAPEPQWAHTATHDVSGGAGHLGELWVARAGGADFTDRDRGFLRTLASLAGIALSSAQMREGARQRAVLNERTRIAREMHDSLAQVLGAVHLRLRALETGVGTLPDDRVVAEVEALADVCAEAYQDVRETILGLRDAVHHAERSLEDNLRRYLDSYSTQSGISARLANEVGHAVSLSPRAEVHVIRDRPGVADQRAQARPGALGARQHPGVRDLDQLRRRGRRHRLRPRRHGRLPGRLRPVHHARPGRPDRRHRADRLGTRSRHHRRRRASPSDRIPPCRTRRTA